LNWRGNAIAPIEDLRTLKILIRDYSLPVDLHPFAKGVDTESVLARSEPTEIDGVPVRVPCFEDLVAMKRAAGRVKDLDDLQHLVAAHDLAGRAGPTAPRS
jgi:predicted nucleotidyltransferase